MNENLPYVILQYSIIAWLWIMFLIVIDKWVKRKR